MPDSATFTTWTPARAWRPTAPNFDLLCAILEKGPYPCLPHREPKRGSTLILEIAPLQIRAGQSEELRLVRCAGAYGLK